MDTKPDVETFGPLAVTPAQRKAEYRKRRRAFDECTFKSSEVDNALATGWLESRQLKSGVRMRRAKPIDEILENQFWCVLYELGYDELNIGRQFKILVSKKNAPIETKQIDVFAKDDETIVIAECKANAKPARRSLQKDIGEFASLQKAIATAARKHFNGFKSKIIWLFVTRNIIWSDSDEERAARSNIKILREKEIRYLAEISKSLGYAAKYQFHGEFLANQKIPALSNKIVPAIRIKLGGRWAYNFSIRPDDLMRISFVNHRDLRDPSGAPSYQRLVKPARLKSPFENWFNG